MTTTHPATTAPSTLPPGWLACAWCGQSVTTADQTPAAEVRVRASGREGVPRLVGQREVELTFTTCRECRATLATADRLLTDHPALLRRYGTVVTDRLRCAVMALAVLGQPPDGVDPAAAIDHLALPGGNAAWSRRFTPVLAADAAVGTAATTRWGHLTPGQLDRLRSDYGAILRARVQRAAPPQRIPPPATSALPGCLVCGLAAVTVPASQVAGLGGEEQAADAVWSSATLPIGPTRLAGHLCPACADARESAGGAVGPTMAEKSLLAHLEATGRSSTAQRLRVAFTGDYHVPVPTWAQWVHSHGVDRRPVDPAPPAEPWAFLRLSD